MLGGEDAKLAQHHREAGYTSALGQVGFEQYVVVVSVLKLKLWS